MTANDGGDADAALVLRFRQAQTRQESAAVFANVVRRHRDEVLACCAERLWPDADAAVAAAGDVFIAAGLAMADSAKLAHPDLLRAWLVGIMAHGIHDIDWEALQADVAANFSELRESSATRASVRHWLDQIVATLPEPRQRLYDLFVTRSLNSRNAALELGSDVSEVQRLRRENQQAIMRAFEVTALTAAETASDQGNEAPGCWELRQILANAPRDGDPREDGQRHIAVLPAALRLAVTRHLSQCVTCQEHSDDCMAWWAPALLPVLAGAELSEQVMEDLRLIPEFGRPRVAPGAHRRGAPVGAFRKVFIRTAATTGGGLLVALLLLAFVWPGFLDGTEAAVHRGSTAPSAPDPSGSHLSTPLVTGEIGGVPSRNSGRQVNGRAAGPVGSPSQAATVPSSSATQTFPVRSTVSPSNASTSPSAQATSAPAPTSSPSAKSPSPTAHRPTPTASPSTSAPATPVPTTSAPATPTPTTAAPTTPAPSTPTSTPSGLASATAPSASPSTSASS